MRAVLRIRTFSTTTRSEIRSLPQKLTDLLLQEQLNLMTNQRETLQTPTKTHTLPEQVLDEIKRLGLDRK